MTPARIRVTFRKPIFLDDEVQCRFAESKGVLSIWCGNVRLISVALDFGDVPASGIATSPGDTASQPAVLSDADFLDRELRPLRLRGDSQRAELLFPVLCASLGRERVCDLGATSEVVGMQVPGLHSLYLSLHVDFAQQLGDAAPYFRIEAFDPRFRILSLTVETGSLSAKVSALVRQPPTVVTSIDHLATDIDSDEFVSVNALIVGGSRGLGEAAAKLIARGGGTVTLTYNVGSADAHRIADEIALRGGRARTLQLDVAELDQIGNLDVKGVNQLYFFATPKIFGKRNVTYDAALRARFKLFYVDAFAAIVERCRLHTPHLAVFFPSTVAIDEPLPELAEYIAAKIEGEELCADLNSRAGVRVLSPRLPRIETDQTASVVAAAALDAVDVMTPLVRAMAVLGGEDRP